MSHEYANITTTGDIAGWEIQAYLGVVSSHLVAGTGLFSDFAAGLTDIFGGRSGTYQRQLSGLYTDALGALQKAAAARGGNWVIGLSVDFDEISGKGTQMFMVRASGTAVKAQQRQRQVESAPLSDREVSAKDVQSMQRRQRIAEVARESGAAAIDDATWEFLLEQGPIEGLSLVLRAVAADLFSDVGRRGVEYVRALPPDAAAKALYGTLGDPTVGVAAAFLLQEAPLSRLTAVLAAMDEPDPVPYRALQTLRVDQPTYSADDLPIIDELVRIIPDRFPSRAQHSVDQGMFKGPRWTCGFCGSKANRTEKYCIGCQRDEAGFLKSDVTPVKALEMLSGRRHALATLLQGAGV